MDIPTIITAILSSGLVSLGAARWFTTRLIDHQLNKDLKNHEATLAERLEIFKGEIEERHSVAKASLEAQLRRGVEEYLGDKAADRQYRLDARKRLYAAIGPLRFQLVVACVDFSARVERIGTGKQKYPTSLEGYFGRSTAFRLLRVLATAELIERQMAYADFSVDASTADLLQFKREAFLCLASSTVSLDHPQTKWDKQVEHIYYDALSMIAATMIVTDGAGTPSRVMRFDEFNQFVSHDEKLALLHPLPRLLYDFTIEAKPILWIRLVSLGELCSSLVKRDGSPLGVTAEPYDGQMLLNVSTDAFVVQNRGRYREVIQRFQDFGLARSGADKGMQPPAKRDG